MRALQGILPTNLRNTPFMGLVFFALALFGAYEAAVFIIDGDTAGLIYVGLAFIVATFVIAMLNNWRRALYIFLVWLLFEDFARKYLGNNMAIYFAKDFLVAVVYLSFFLAWRRKQLQSFRPPFLVPVVLMVWFGFLQVFNPASTHLVYGVLGMKLLFYYIPLMFVGYAVVDSEIMLRRFFVMNFIPILIIAALGIAQSILGPTFLNPAALQEDIRDLGTLYRVAPISGVSVYRPTSVFVSTGRYVDLLYVAWLLALGFLGYTLLRYQKGRWLAFLSVSMIAAGLVLTASRGAFLWGVVDVFVVFGAFLWGAPWRQREVMRVLRTMVRTGLGVALAGILLLFAFPDALLGRLAIYSETLSPDSPASELTYRARDYPIKNFLAAFTYDRWPYGYGIGTTCLGIQYVNRIFGVKPPVVGVESGFGTLIVEMGIGGLILWLIMTVAILFSVWKLVLYLRGSPWFPIGFTIFFYASFLLVPAMVGGMAYEDFLMNAYFWLLLGILFRLPQMKAAAELAGAEYALARQQQQRWAT
jgi:hypothetical protein